MNSVGRLFAVVALGLAGCTPSPAPMTTPDAQNPWVIRTDFSSDEKWAAVSELVAAPQNAFGETFYAYVRFVRDQTDTGMDPETLVHALPEDYPGFVCFVVDVTTLADDEHPLLVVGFSPNSLDVEDYRRTPNQSPAGDIRTFRAVPSTIQSIENNLSTGNMDVEEFAESIDEDGVFRGFGRTRM